MPTTLIAIERVFLWFLLYSFVGWLWETCLNIVMKKRFVDRGMLNGPLCPIYGFGAMIVIFALRGEHSIVAVFLSSGVLACTLEYFTSWLIEKLFHVRFWDYSNKPFNINGRVYLNGFLFFAAGATAVKFWVQPHVEKWLALIPPVPLTIVSAVLLALLLVDFAITLAGLISLRSRLGRAEADIKAWKKGKIARIDVGITSADRRIEQAETRVQHATSGAMEDVRAKADELAAKVHHTFSWQQRRLIEAFPAMRLERSGKTPHHVRKLLERYRRQR